MDRDTFEVTAEHVKLLRAANVSWDRCEFGAPAIDCKRPYGNSNAFGDIAEILGIEPDGNEEFSLEQEIYMDRVHKGTKTALQIFLATGEMRAGHYVAPKYSNEWKAEIAST